MSVIIVPLYNVPCGVCGGPATVLKIYPNGRVCTVHVMTRREDERFLEITCWAFPGPLTQDSGVDEPRNKPGRCGPSSPTSPAPATRGPARPINDLNALRWSA